MDAFLFMLINSGGNVLSPLFVIQYNVVTCCGLVDPAHATGLMPQCHKAQKGQVYGCFLFIFPFRFCVYWASC